MVLPLHNSFTGGPISNLLLNSFPNTHTRSLVATNRFLNLINMMRHLAAYLLLKTGGNDAPTAADVTAALAAAGVEADAASLSAFLKEVEGKDIAELIESASDRIFVGGGGGGAAAGPAAAGEDAAPVKEEKPKEEEVDALDGGMDMFGGSAGGGDY